MNNLSKDLLEEILSRVPTTSLRKVRSTCKKWNTLSKKHLAQSPPRTSKGEILAIVLINCSLRLMSVNLNDFDHPSIKLTGTLISLNSSDKLDITQVYHCEGLLLCSYFEDEVTLSNVGEEQLAVLFQNLDTYEMEFFTGGSFLIDEERRVVVVFDGDKNVSETSRNIAYFIGENDYFKEVDLGEVTTCEVFPHAFSYVPSSVQIN
ncbi:BnaC05g37580D [Brassica napus]|uniref:BnaC05g37580D protein n=1 Tax=Brassica napus TaxID=3708 RepID=A0A078GYA6_BRANA|nr:BnaC05g37580D [Brassica napus]